MAVSRRPPIPLDTIVARTYMYTYAANVWDLSLVQGPFSVAPRSKPAKRQRYDPQRVASLYDRRTWMRVAAWKAERPTTDLPSTSSSSSPMRAPARPAGDSITVPSTCRTAMEKLRIVILGFARRDRKWSLNDGRIQNPSNPFGILPLSNFVPRGFGFVHHSIAKPLPHDSQLCHRCTLPAP
jgi:hypothetical protein